MNWCMFVWRTRHLKERASLQTYHGGYKTKRKRSDLVACLWRNKEIWIRASQEEEKEIEKEWWKDSKDKMDYVETSVLILVQVSIFISFGYSSSAKAWILDGKWTGKIWNPFRQCLHLWRYGLFVIYSLDRKSISNGEESIISSSSELLNDFSSLVYHCE